MKASKYNNYLYNKNLKQKARELRLNSTKSEIILWINGFKKKQRKGYTFTRQRPVLNYIVDFMCKELLIIIELDGITHTYDEIYIKDRLKDKELSSVGFKILRFQDEDVFDHLDIVLDSIDRCIGQREVELDIKNTNDSAPKNSD